MFAQRLRELRTSKKLSQQDLADLVGKTQQAVNLWEKGENEPGHETLKKLADFFSVTVDYLLGHEGRISSAHAGQERKSSSDLNGQIRDGFRTIKMVEVPVYELDAKGEEILADSNIIGWHYVPAEQMDCICFRVPDDSMSGSGLYTDYLVTVIKQTTAEDGKIAIVKSKDGHFRIRRVRYFNDEVLLDPDNPRYQSERININELVIIGVVTDASFKVI